MLIAAGILKKNRHLLRYLVVIIGLPKFCFGLFTASKDDDKMEKTTGRKGEMYEWLCI